MQYEKVSLKTTSKTGNVMTVGRSTINYCVFAAVIYLRLCHVCKSEISFIVTVKRNAALSTLSIFSYSNTR